jgi:hypothetical protein
MKDIQFVNAEDLESLEQYGAALISSVISLKTLESFHIAAFNKGLLDDDEAETGKTICWEIQRLLSLYKTQIENILDRTELNEEQVLKGLKSMMPNIKIPKKRKYTKKVQDGQPSPEKDNI